ncbi:TPA: GDSL-type esterase/lipase family protein [Providencia stuartii]
MILKKIVVAGLFLMPFTISAKALVIGDSLAFPIAESLKVIIPTDGFFLESTGLNDKSTLNWFDYIQSLDVTRYDNVIISLGANDGIQSNDIDSYQQKAVMLIKQLQNANEQALVTWVLPPVLKDAKKEMAVNNTRKALNHACNATGINCFDPAVAIGHEFSYQVNGVPVRSQDGIHYTSQGAEFIVNKMMGVK